MESESKSVFEEVADDIYSSLLMWYTHEWCCKGLNNDEIEEEFATLLEDIRDAECTCDTCKLIIVEKYIEILQLRKKYTKSELTRKRFSIAMVINSLSHFTETSMYCGDCRVDHALKDLFESYYWMGVLFGAEREREDYGRGISARKASDSNHSYNRERRLALQDWYRKNHHRFSSKDEAAMEASHKFHLGFSAARKHLRNI